MFFFAFYIQQSGANQDYILEKVLSDHTSWIQKVIVRENNIASSTYEDGKVMIHDLEAGTLLNTFDHPGRVAGLAYNLNGNLLASGGNNSEVRVWDVRNGELIRTLNASEIIDGIKYDRSVGAVAFFDDKIAANCLSGYIRMLVWDAANGWLVNEYNDSQDWANSVCCSSLGKMAAAGPYGVITCWNPHDNSIKNKDYDLANGGEVIGAIAISPLNSDFMAATSNDWSIENWSRDNLPTDLLETTVAVKTLFDVSKENSLIHVSSGGKGTIKTLNFADASKPCVINEGDAFFIQVACAPGNENLIAAAYHKGIKILDTKAGSCLNIDDPNIVQTVAFAGYNDEIIVSGSNDSLIKIWKKNN